MLAYHLTPVPLIFVHIDGLKISTDKSTLFSKLEVRIITAATRNVDASIVDGMFLVVSCKFAFNFWWSSKCDAVSSCQTCKLCIFCTCILLNIHQLMILPEIMVCNRGEVNVFRPEQGIPKYLTQALKSKLFKTFQLR